MDLLRALYNSYNYAEKHNMVDIHGEETVLLPLFHNSLRSTGDNVMEIVLKSNGEFFDAEFIEKDKYLIFPVTYYSSTRSGRMPPPHPLLDKGIYIIPSELEHHQLYREGFLSWKNKVKEEKVYQFLDLIDKYTSDGDWFSQLIDEKFKDYTREDLVITYKSDGKDKKIDFKDVYFSFKINNFLDGKDTDITSYVDLHKSYIDYVEANLEYDGICNISGEKDFISRRHRGLLGNSRLVSVSNNIETYRGRFKSGDDIFNLGFITSEKAHLMLRYLTENPNSNKFLGDTQYLINWFSDDIANESMIDLTDPNVNHRRRNKYRKIVSKQNKDVGSSFIKGQIRFNQNANYYILLLDKSSAGRVSIKYFKSLPVSKLVENLKKWNDLYNWPTYIEEIGELEDRVPSFYNIMVSSYGVERDGKLIVDKAAFTKDQIQKMITAMIEGEELQENIRLSLAKNIRQRNRYDKTWNQMKRVALSVLRNEREERYSDMLDKENMNRSYLYGRLLAVYELIEASTYGKEIDGRLTNAEKFWTAYINNPARTQVTLERNVQVYLNKLMKGNKKEESEEENQGQINKVGLAIKYKKAKSEIIEAISKIYKEDPKELTKPLDFDFIFGYEAQKSELFKSSKNKEEEK